MVKDEEIEKLQKLVDIEREKNKQIEILDKLEGEYKELKSKNSKLNRISKRFGQVSEMLNKEGAELKKSGIGINPDYLKFELPNLGYAGKKLRK